MGLSGAVVGGTAVYLWGLTAATGTVGATCGAGMLSKRPVLAPVAHHGGAGIAAAMAF